MEVTWTTCTSPLSLALTSTQNGSLWKSSLAESSYWNVLTISTRSVLLDKMIASCPQHSNMLCSGLSCQHMKGSLLKIPLSDTYTWRHIVPCTWFSPAYHWPSVHMSHAQHLCRGENCRGMHNLIFTIQPAHTHTHLYAGKIEGLLLHVVNQ